MKKYVKPMMEGQIFEANEYIASCGDENKVYIFECNAPAGTLYYYKKSDGVIDGVYNGNGNASKLGSFHPNPEATHQASTTADFFDGYIDANKNGRHDQGEGVIVWIEFGSRGTVKNAHATKELDMNSWVTSKS